MGGDPVWPISADPLTGSLLNIRDVIEKYLRLDDLGFLLLLICQYCLDCTRTTCMFPIQDFRGGTVPCLVPQD